MFTISNTEQIFLFKTSALSWHLSILIQNPSHVHMLFGSEICQH